MSKIQTVNILVVSRDQKKAQIILSKTHFFIGVDRYFKVQIQLNLYYKFHKNVDLAKLVASE